VRWGALVAVLGGLAGCEAQHGALLADRLRECALLTEGELGTALANGGVYAPDECYERCLARASCAEIEDSLCRTSVSLLVACDQECAFRCDDGGLIGVEHVCDGYAQCMGREDEEGCDFALVCGDGTHVPGARCDGAWNCPDGSDENGCSVAAFPCDDGRGTYSRWQQCDGYLSCPDGSDEHGCPSHRCANGQVLTYGVGRAGPRCDGWSQCGDGSDELDCARVTLTCGS
jgi:hypothetical protein